MRSYTHTTMNYCSTSVAQICSNIMSTSESMVFKCDRSLGSPALARLELGQPNDEATNERQDYIAAP